MMEPTEIEYKETVDELIESRLQIERETEENLDIILEAPHLTVIKRMDEALTARQPVLRNK
ncbi:hypothetical protein D8M04_02125 [Oceanobacillus piezotolerans]|uniref:Uncharacterized protein n=1 Tax=Oceanobacillus piezotolerans TaxID=2448030 RepID=A0A498DAF2_9BACI|nr:hypothetical protein D8M04_02125 [Oceanobacillus piezotolerans]